MVIFRISNNHVNQRIDNFLFTHLKGLPKSRIYRALRQGEIRVNKKRIKPDYRLQYEDEIRLPSFSLSTQQKTIPTPGHSVMQWLEKQIIHEDKKLLIINKPAGMPVHGGTKISAGIIETLRAMRPKQQFLELVHRLDRDTSGCLLVAKKRSLLVRLHHLLTNRALEKQYLMLVKGIWPKNINRVTAPLLKNVQSSGERIVVVRADGKPAETLFTPLRYFKNATLVQARPITGRTHQIRVHAAYAGYPIAGDNKYGDAEFNKWMRTYGLKRLFLHSAAIDCQIEEDQRIAICALLDEDLHTVLHKLCR